MFIERPRIANYIDRAFGVHPVVALEGSRQSGKTTLAKSIAASRSDSHYFDLEHPKDADLLKSPLFALSELSGFVIIDEVQIQPKLYEIIRVVVDDTKFQSRILILGSASPLLVKGVAESLAGRVALVEMSGLCIDEVELSDWPRLWMRGGFPRSYLANDDELSQMWRKNFVRHHLGRELPLIGISVSTKSLQQFWTMLAHYHGQIWNSAEFARALGSSESTARTYLNILEGTFVARVLPPWYENLKKRQVKSPKVYIRDSGLLHELLHIESNSELMGHPKVGASFEGFVVEQILSILGSHDAYYWATYRGAELDLLVMVRGKRYGFEVKYSDAPRVTPSMRIALDDLRLEHLWVVYPGTTSYEIHSSISVTPVTDLPQLLESLKSRK